MTNSQYRISKATSSLLLVFFRHHAIRRHVSITFLHPYKRTNEHKFLTRKLICNAAFYLITIGHSSLPLLHSTNYRWVRIITRAGGEIYSMAPFANLFGSIRSCVVAIGTLWYYLWPPKSNFQISSPFQIYEKFNDRFLPFLDIRKGWQFPSLGLHMSWRGMKFENPSWEATENTRA